VVNADQNRETTLSKSLIFMIQSRTEKFIYIDDHTRFSVTKDKESTRKVQFDKFYRYIGAKFPSSLAAHPLKSRITRSNAKNRAILLAT